MRGTPTSFHWELVSWEKGASQRSWSCHKQKHIHHKTERQETPWKKDSSLLVLKVEVAQSEMQTGSLDHGGKWESEQEGFLIETLRLRSGPHLKKDSSSFKGWFPMFFQSSNSPVIFIIILCTWHRQLHFYEFSITFCHSLDNTMRFITT